jgi:hypothetical protein
MLLIRRYQLLGRLVMVKRLATRGLCARVWVYLLEEHDSDDDCGIA